MFLLDLIFSSFFLPQMLLFDIVVAYIAGIVSFVIMYCLLTHQETTVSRLKARNITLSSWLQIAEAQTGTPYYSAVACGAEPEEANPLFHTHLQNKIKNRSPPVDFEEEPTYEALHEL
jgi:hypothetical protein